MPPKRKRSAIYVRLSRDRAGETSTERQEKDARALAAARGFRVVDVFSDVDLSAFKPGVVRPAYEAMLATARAGKIDAVVVWKVDRLARSLREFVRVTELLDECGVALVSVNESLDTSSPMGRAMLQIIGVFAELESATISLRTRSAKDHNAAHGLPNGGGRRPFGYTNQTFDEIVPEEADLLKEAAGQLLDGSSLRSIALDWNDRGFETTSGSAWTSSNLGRTLRSPHLAGYRRHRGQLVRGTWPAVFNDDEHVRIVMTAGEHRAATVRRHLLTGIARCGACGGSLRGKKTRRFGFQYACQRAGCSRVAIKGAGLELMISGAVLHRLDSPALLKALRAQDDSEAARRMAEEVAEDRAALEQLSRDHYVTRTVSREVFLASAGELEDRIRATDARVNRLQPSLAVITGAPVREAWEQETLEWRRALVELLVTRVIVNRTAVRGRSSFDPERIEVEWRV